MSPWEKIRRCAAPPCAPGRTHTCPTQLASSASALPAAAKLLLIYRKREKNWDLREHQFNWNMRPVHLNGKRSWQERTPREQRRQRRCRPWINQQSNVFFRKLNFRGKVSLPQSTRQLPWYRRQGAGNCWWMPAGEGKCQNQMKNGMSGVGGWCTEEGVSCFCETGLGRLQKYGEEMWAE